jgi:hypothetical protein
MARILYLHGSGGRGTSPKAETLREAGHTVIAPDVGTTIDGADLGGAIRRVRAEIETESPDVVVASSRGAALAIALPGQWPLVLICPAIERFDRVRHIDPARCVRILHNRQDDLIPWREVEALVERSGLAVSCLWEAGSGHAPNDEALLSALRQAVSECLRGS